MHRRNFASLILPILADGLFPLTMPRTAWFQSAYVLSPLTCRQCLLCHGTRVTGGGPVAETSGHDAVYILTEFMAASI